MRRGAMALAAVLLCACAESKLSPGGYRSGLAVEADGPTVEAARRSALSDVIDLFISTEAIAAHGAELNEKLLPRAHDLIPRERVVSPKGSSPVKLRALVSLDKVGRELESLDLLKPAGVAGRPILLIRVSEAGPGSGTGAAAEAMRAALSERGYTAVDLSSATKDAANAQAKKLASGAIVMASARSEAAPDARLEGLRPCSATISVKAVAAPNPEVVADFSAEATALDASESAAGAKALSDAGEIAAARLRRELARRFVERTEMSVLFDGLGGPEKAHRLLAELRGRPGIQAAAIDSIIGDDVKVRVFTDGSSADELAAELLRLPGRSLSVRAVDADYHSIELDAGSHAF